MRRVGHALAVAAAAVAAVLITGAPLWIAGALAWHDRGAGPAWYLLLLGACGLAGTAVTLAQGRS